MNSQQSPRIVIVGEDTRQRDALGDILKKDGYEVVYTESSGETVRSVTENPTAVALIDTFLSGAPPHMLTHGIRKASPQTECIILLGHPSHRDAALSSIEEGAYGYILRGPDNHQLLLVVRRAIERRQLMLDMDEMRRRLAVLFDALPAGILIVDAETRLVVDANAAALDIIGEPKENLAGKVYYTKRRDSFAQSLATASADIAGDELRIPATTSVAEIELGGRRHLIESFVDMTGRLTAEAEARRYRTLTNFLVGHLDDAIVSVDADAAVLAVINPGKTSLEAPVVGQNARALMPPTCHERFERQLMTVFSEGHPAEVVHGSGSSPDWIVQLIPVQSSTGIECVIVSVRELSARQRTEARLRLRNEAFNHIEDAVIIVNAHATVVDANPAVCSWLETTATELVGRSYYDLDRFVPCTKWDDQLKTLTEQVQVEYESQLYNSEGVRHRVRVAMQLATIGGERYAICVYERLTKVIQMDETIHTLENTEAVLLSTPLDPVFILDREGVIMRLNDAAANTLPQGRMKAVGSLYFEHLPGEIATEHRRRLEDVLLVGHPTRFEDHRQGRTYEHILKPVHDHAGALSHVILMTRDLTEAREQKRRLAEAFEKAPDGTWILDAKATLAYIEEADPTLRENPEAYLALHEDVIDTCLSSLRLIDASPVLRELLSAADSEVVQLKPAKLLAGRNRLRFASCLVETLTTGRLVEGEIYLRTLRGEECFTHCRLSLSHADDGSPRITAWLMNMESLREAREEVLRASSGERRRIGRELREELIPLFETLKGHAAEADSPGPAAQALRTLERIASGLEKTGVLEGTLIAALQQLAKDVKVRHGIECRCNMGTPKAINDPFKASHLYEIAREAVDFARRNHAATEITIGLTAGKSSSRLTVRDNGHETEAPREDPAWALMHHHAEMIQARLETDYGPRGNLVDCHFH